MKRTLHDLPTPREMGFRPHSQANRVYTLLVIDYTCKLKTPTSGRIDVKPRRETYDGASFWIGFLTGGLIVYLCFSIALMLI